ncbi:hypothetical protein SALB1_3717 [Salinisphaera sp. LB1]|nr:hypothetical protein SALB1_3717 [Salinisphaera sp. LB1]
MPAVDRVQTTGYGIFHVAQHGIDPIERWILNAGAATTADNALIRIKRLIKYPETRQAAALTM